MQFHVLVLFCRILADGTKTANETRENAFEDAYGVPPLNEQIDEWLKSLAEEGEKIEIISLSHSIIPKDECYHIQRRGMR
jgi:hypothetical protein